VSAPAAEQRVCTECGDIFAVGRSDQLTCSGKCRTRKSRREAKGLPEPFGAARRAELLAGIRAVAEEGAIGMAREIMAAEIAPVVREALTSEVLAAIGELVAMSPMMVAAMKEELTGTPVWSDGQMLMGKDGNPLLAVDPDRRLKVLALWAKYTMGSPALAPQAPQEAAPPIAINFGAVPRPDYGANSTATRECAICEEPRTDEDFIDGSDRCRDCQAKLEGAAARLIAE
jgi:predicted  nucleic acid-binding Zn-ribbon protein